MLSIDRESQELEREFDAFLLEVKRSEDLVARLADGPLPDFTPANGFDELFSNVIDRMSLYLLQNYLPAIKILNQLVATESIGPQLHLASQGIPAIFIPEEFFSGLIKGPVEELKELSRRYFESVKEALAVPRKKATA